MFEHAVKNTQAIALKEKLLNFNSQFNTASESVHAQMLQDIDRGMHLADQEEQNPARI